MTRALITGAAGFVASHLIEYLIAKTDWHITGTLRWQESLDNLSGVLPLANKKERIEFVHADLRDAWSLLTAVRRAKPDHVFHLAAQSYPLTSFTSAEETMDTNAGGTLRLLEAIRDAAPDAWVHNCSSSEVYGRVRRDQLPIREDCPFAPASPYAVSKCAADMMGRFYAEAYGLKVVTTRMFTHTGPRRGDVFAESSFAKQIAMIEAGQMKPPVKVGNLESLRTVADVRDAVRAYHMALTVNPQAGEVYNIGGDHVCRVGEILEVLFRLAAMPAEVEIDQVRLRPIDADLQVPDCAKFQAHTGWKAEIGFEETMRDLLTYWRLRVSKGPCLNR